LKAIQLGLGVFGNGWYVKMKQEHPEIELTVVDRNEKMKERLISPNDKFYTSLEDALAAERPDFILNVTPPAAHDAVNALAFAHKLPVLCEKPISDNYIEARRLVNLASRENLPFVIAEPYRRNTVFRTLRRLLLQEGRIGKITNVFIDFHIQYRNPKEYLTKLLKDPMLEDLSIHHLDALRCITGANGLSVYATSFNPEESWFVGNACASALIEMENNIRVCMNGSLVSRGFHTGFYGLWRIEGTEGSISLCNDVISIQNADGLTVISEYPDLPEIDMIDEFVNYIQNGVKPESTASDYIHSQAIVYGAQQSNAQKRLIALDTL